MPTPRPLSHVIRHASFTARVVAHVAALATSAALAAPSPETVMPAKVEEPTRSNDYFGAKPPGESAEIFAPGTVSRPDRFEARIAFSQTNRECYLTETDATFSHPKLLVAHQTQNGWSEFAEVSFAAKFKVLHEPFLSDDDQRLYFTADGDDATPTNRRDFWVVARHGASWSEPTRLPAPLNSEAVEFYYNESSDGTVVFASNRPGGQGDFDLYQTINDGAGSPRVTNLGTALNTPGPEYDPCISADGRLIVFASARHGPHLDLYVTHRDDANTWSTPALVAGNINTPANEYAPTLTRDGRYLFFVRHDGKQSDVYWIATSAILSPR